jgi:hypothetical protein
MAKRAKTEGPAFNPVADTLVWSVTSPQPPIARRLGLKATTAQSRAHRLQQRGLIEPRLRGGAYPNLWVQVRQDGSALPVQRPVQCSVKPTPVHRPTNAETSVDRGACRPGRKACRRVNWCRRSCGERWRSGEHQGLRP